MIRVERVMRKASIVALALFFAAVAGVVAQGQPAAAPTAPPADQAPATGDQPADAMSQIDQILAGEDDVMAGDSYSYDPGNRRDPFKSLIEAQLERVDRRGPLPEGPAGLLIDEINLTGIFHTSRGFVAQVRASNKGKSYLLREGDQLYDGDVVSISQTEVVFKQIVNDPTVIKPFREVVKKLSP
jgi:hypothetical protein